MANTYLTKTFSSSPTNAKIGTVSLWFRLAQTAASNTFHRIFATGASATYRTDINITASTGELNFTTVNSSTSLGTTQVLRDESAFYNLVISYDTTQSTASDRVKIYLNGEQITTFSTATYPDQNADLDFGNNSYAHYIGNSPHFSPRFFHGIMSHFHYVDGTAYPASTFGSTDSTTGEWRINTAPSISSYGNNGFWILKDGNTITDSSPNSNNFSLGGGTLTNTQDNPSNVFATMNPLVNTPNGTYSDGNTQFNGGAAHRTAYGTLAFATGKYYWETKATGGTKYTIGLSDAENQSAYQQVAGTNLIVGSNSNSYLKGDAIGWYYSTLYKNGSTIASGLTVIGTNDILRIAVDADAGKIYYAIGATWRVANSTTFNASSNDTTFTTGRFYVPACSNENCGWKFNFGNGYFGTDAVASAGTNASNNGIFEYDVPTGYTALSTKGLNL